MRRRRKSRSRQTLRNWLIFLALVTAMWALDGFPPLTKQAMVRDVLNDQLMNEGEIVWEEINRNGYNIMYLLSGGTVVRTTYHRNILTYDLWDSKILYGNEGVTCIPGTATPGEFLVMGSLPKAASAVLELRMGWQMYQKKDWEYTAEGAWKSGKVISFTIRETYEGDEDFLDKLRGAAIPELYYDYTLRLYDEAGGLIGTWNGPEMQETA